MTSDPTSEAIRGRFLPEGLDVFLGVLGGHVDGVWRAKRAVGGVLASEASGGGVLPSAARLPPGGLASSRRRRRIASFKVILDLKVILEL